MMIVSLFIYQKIRLFPLGHYRIFPIYIFIYEFFFDPPIFIETIYSHDSIAISHDILYTSHLYGIVILGISQRMDSKKFCYCFMTALVFCWYWSYYVTDPVSFI